MSDESLKFDLVGHPKNDLVLTFGWISCAMEITYFFVFLELYPNYSWPYAYLAGAVFSPLAARLIYVKRFESIAVDVLALCTCLPNLLSCAYSGYFASPSLYWFSAFPLCIGLLMGKRRAVIWCGIMAFLVLCLFPMEYYGIGADAPLFYNDPLYRTVNAVVFVVAVSTFVILGISSRDKAWMLVRDQREEYKKVIRLLSHDLTTPLTVLRAQVHRWEKRLNKGQSADVQTTDLEFMGRSFDVIEDILNRVRNIEAITAGKKGAQISTVDLIEVVDFCCDLMQEQLTEKGVKIIRSYEVDHAPALLDSVSFRSSVLTNLLINAIKFSFENGEIFVSIKDQGKEWSVLVEDRGIGMGPELIGNLFRYGTKTSRPGTAGERGTGFGMPLVKAALDSMGGRIEVQSISVESGSKNHGTTMLVFIPKSKGKIISSGEGGANAA